MNQPKLQLHHYWRSSCSWRLRWALALKGLNYESVAVNILKQEHRSQAYMALNPAGFLPALIIGGVAYGESLALIDWLDETSPSPSLYPQDPLARLRVRQMALTIVAGTQPLQNPATVQYFLPDGDTAARTAAMRYMIQRGLGIYEQLLTTAPHGPFSWGDQISVADLCLVPQVYNAIRFEVDLTALPNVAAIYRRCLATEACAQAAPEQWQG